MRAWLRTLAVLAAVGSAGPAAAQGSLDQQNGGATPFDARCATPARSLYQSFVPQVTPLVAVELEVRGVEALGDSVWLRIRAGEPWGAILAEVETFAGAAGWIHFDLESPLPVAPGSSYVLEWVRPLGWYYNDSNTYAGGWAYDCLGNPRLDWDFHFRTYAGGAGVQATPWGHFKALYTIP